MDISEKIKAIRKHKGMTQQQLADALFLSHNTISYYENGRDIPLSTLPNIANALGVGISDLLTEQDEEALKNMTFFEKIATYARKSGIEVRLRSLIANELLNSEYDYIMFEIEGYGEEDYHQLEQKDKLTKYANFSHVVNDESTENLIERFWDKDYDEQDEILEKAIPNWESVYCQL